MVRMFLGAVVGLLAGLGLGWLHLHTLAVTAAINIPQPLWEFARRGGDHRALLLVWDLLVVQFVGTGIPTLLVTFVLARYLPFEILCKVLGLIVGAICVVLLPIALDLGMDVLLSPNIRHHLYEFMLLSCSIGAAWLAYKK